MFSWNLVSLDLASFQSMQQSAEAFKARPLHILAGIGMMAYTYKQEACCRQDAAETVTKNAHIQHRIPYGTNGYTL